VGDDRHELVENVSEWLGPEFRLVGNLVRRARFTRGVRSPGSQRGIRAPVVRIDDELEELRRRGRPLRPFRGIVTFFVDRAFVSSVAARYLSTRGM